MLADVERLVRNLIAMNEILRDRERATIRLVMTPDRMVVDEAMRTFTYLNLYGYVTDAVVVNRVFPEAVAGTYFEAWRERQQAQLAEVDAGFAPVPVLRAPFFDEEVVGERMLDRLGDAVFAEHDAAAVLHADLAHELEVTGDSAVLRIALPFAEKGQLALKRIGVELVVRVGGQKRTIMLPPALARYRPVGASLENGFLEVSFDGSDRTTAPAGASFGDVSPEVAPREHEAAGRPASAAAPGGRVGSRDAATEPEAARERPADDGRRSEDGERREPGPAHPRGRTGPETRPPGRRARRRRPASRGSDPPTRRGSSG